MLLFSMLGAFVHRCEVLLVGNLTILCPDFLLASCPIIIGSMVSSEHNIICIVAIKDNYMPYLRSVRDEPGRVRLLTLSARRGRFFISIILSSFKCTR